MQLFDPNLHEGAPSDLFGQAKYLYNGIIDTVHLIRNGDRPGRKIPIERVPGRIKRYLESLEDGSWSFDKNRNLYNEIVPVNKEILGMLRLGDMPILYENDMASSFGAYSSGGKIVYNVPYNNNERRRTYTLDTAFHESKHEAQGVFWKSFKEFSAFSHHVGGIGNGSTGFFSKVQDWINVNILGHAGTSNYFSPLNAIEEDARTYGHSFGKYDKSHLNTDLSPYLEDLSNMTKEEYWIMRGARRDANGKWIGDKDGYIKIDDNYGKYGDEIEKRFSQFIEDNDLNNPEKWEEYINKVSETGYKAQKGSAVHAYISKIADKAITDAGLDTEQSFMMSKQDFIDNVIDNYYDTAINKDRTFNQTLRSIRQYKINDEKSLQAIKNKFANFLGDTVSLKEWYHQMRDQLNTLDPFSSEFETLTSNIVETLSSRDEKFCNTIDQDKFFKLFDKKDMAMFKDFDEHYGYKGVYPKPSEDHQRHEDDKTTTAVDKEANYAEKLENMPLSDFDAEEERLTNKINELSERQNEAYKNGDMDELSSLNKEIEKVRQQKETLYDVGDKRSKDIDNTYTDDVIEKAIGNPETKYQYNSPVGPSREGIDKTLAANSATSDNEHTRAHEEQELANAMADGDELHVPSTDEEVREAEEPSKETEATTIEDNTEQQKEKTKKEKAAERKQKEIEQKMQNATSPPETTEDVSSEPSNLGQSESETKRETKINKSKPMGWKGKAAAFGGVLMAANIAYSMMAGGNSQRDMQHQESPSFFGQSSW